MHGRLSQGDRRGGWEALELLGTGGVGEVWRCAGPDGRTGALKVLLANTRDVDRARFHREMAALEKLDHPAIVGLVDAGFDDVGQPWLVMEYVAGETLEAYLERAGAVPMHLAVTWFADLAYGLAHCHESGIHHRDIKANNVIVRDGGGFTLVDFGAAISRLDNRVTQQGAVLGTASYMPPEVCLGEERDPVLCDIYALGQLMCETVTGRLLFRPDPELQGLRQLRAVLTSKVESPALDPGDGFDEWLRTAIRRATEPVPAQRLDSCLQLALLLDRARSGDSLHTPMLALGRDDPAVEDGVTWEVPPAEALRADRRPPVVLYGLGAACLLALALAAALALV